MDLQAAILAALRRRDGAMVVGEGAPGAVAIERGRQLKAVLPWAPLLRSLGR
jgi:hypothetical protein